VSSVFEACDANGAPNAGGDNQKETFFAPAAKASVSDSTSTPTCGTVDGGGTWPAGAYQVSLVFYDILYQTTLNSADCGITVGSGQQIRVDPPPLVEGAAGWCPYVSTVGGTTATETLQFSNVNQCPRDFQASLFLSGPNNGAARPAANTTGQNAVLQYQELIDQRFTDMSTVTTHVVQECMGPSGPELQAAVSVGAGGHFKALYDVWWSQGQPTAVLAPCSFLLRTPQVGNGGLTSWVQSTDGPHFLYVDGNQHLPQLWNTISTGQWAGQDLTTVPNAVPVGPGSALTSWVQSDDGPHVVYVDAKGNVNQLWYTIRTGQWAAQSLMNVPNTVPAGPGSAVTSWVQSDDGPHVVYVDANGNLNQLWYTIRTGQWAAQSLMNVPNTVPAGPGSAVTSWVQSDDGPHVVYADANGNLHQLWYTIRTGQWAAQSLMNLPNVVAVGPGSAMTSWVQSDDGPHVVYADPNGHVRQIWYTLSTGRWTADDLTQDFGAALVAKRSGMTSWVQSDDGPHVVYADANGHVQQIWYTLSTKRWATEDLTNDFLNGLSIHLPLVANGSAMTSWVQSNDGPHFVYSFLQGPSLG
jgi:DNA recombination-dependent growth factor C